MKNPQPYLIVMVHSNIRRGNKNHQQLLFDGHIFAISQEKIVLKAEVDIPGENLDCCQIVVC